MSQSTARIGMDLTVAVGGPRRRGKRGGPQPVGCGAVVLELVPAELAAEVTRTLHIPTVGIGA
ncbi:3-methyl-2-oxobutanoate hydroxymethyltransferase, partial [Streptomyces parvus]